MLDNISKWVTSLDCYRIGPVFNKNAYANRSDILNNATTQFLCVERCTTVMCIRGTWEVLGWWFCINYHFYGIKIEVGCSICVEAILLNAGQLFHFCIVATGSSELALRPFEGVHCEFLHNIRPSMVPPAKVALRPNFYRSMSSADRSPVTRGRCALGEEAAQLSSWWWRHRVNFSKPFVGSWLLKVTNTSQHLLVMCK